jgi:DNA polymerase (family 10)
MVAKGSIPPRLEPDAGEPPIANDQIADVFEQVATLLERQAASRFRVAAYRTAARTIRGLQFPLGKLFEREGIGGLQRLPRIGESLA